MKNVEWERFKHERRQTTGNGSDDLVPELVSLRNLDNEEFEPVQMIVDDLLPEGLTIFAGPSKIGKSWAAFHIGLCVAAGGPTLGSIRTTRSGVAYLALEDNRRRLHARMRKLLGNEPVPDNFLCATDWPKGPPGIAHLDNFLRENTATRLVVIDPWIRLRAEPAGRLSAYAQDYADLAPLHAVANANKVAILLITHTRKAEALDVMNRISGTTGTQGMADAMWVLTRTRGQLLGELSVTGRDLIHDGTYAVSFSKETGRWTLLGEAQAIKRESEQDRLYQFLFAQQEPVGLRDIADALGMRINTVRSALQRLQNRGGIERVGRNAWTVRRGSNA
jgi:RecA-family ATPase